MWSRRALLAAGVAAGLAAARTAAAPAKVSKAAADYRPKPHDGLSCAACTLFRPPDACAVVAGDISASGWCKFFALPD